ncbi:MULTISPECIES: hypothetical protein [unclassified Nostoc]|nr:MULTISPECIES: hypothetical protein [unclassified Nostoc]
MSNTERTKKLMRLIADKRQSAQMTTRDGLWLSVQIAGDRVFY